MKKVMASLMLLVALLPIGMARAEIQPRVDKAAIETFLKESDDTSYYERPEFEKDLVQALKANRDLKKAEATLATKYGLSPALMEKFAPLVIQWVIHRELADFDDAPWDKQDELRNKNYDEIRAAFIALVHEAQFKPLVFDIAVNALDRACSLSDYKSLLEGSPDMRRDAWRALELVGECNRWHYQALTMYPGDDAVLWKSGSSPGMTSSQRLAIYRHLDASPQIMALPVADRDALRTAIARRYVGHLWTAGFVAEGIAYYEGLPQNLRENLLRGLQPKDPVTLNGLRIDLAQEAKSVADDEQEYDPANPFHGDHQDSRFVVNLIAAYLAQGRLNEAAGLAKADAHHAKARWMIDCLTPSDSDRRACFDKAKVPASNSWMAIEYMINLPKEDPYPVVELEFANSFDSGTPRQSSGLWVQLWRKLLDEDTYGVLRRNVARGWRVEYLDRDDRDMPQLFGSVLPKDVLASEADFRARTRQLRASLGAVEDELSDTDGNKERSAAIAQSAFRFPEQKLVDSCSAKRNRINVRTTLPQGYDVVRVEKEGHRVVAISLSQDLDPAGEVSAGGYWVHISDDDGKSWKNLYTGLAQYFPYVVAPSSCRPMIAGDHLDVEVEIAELDRRSISYPPVGLATKRRVKGLFLTMPLSELQKDSDEDQLTDIEEEHLLLDPHNPDSDGDGVRDGRDPLPNVVNAKVSTPLDGAMGAVLGRIFGGSFGAIIEGVDRPPGDVLGSMGTGLTRDSASPFRPIFIEGEAKDYASIKPPSMMLVYTPEQIARIETMTPIFHAVELNPVVHNRKGTRGFAVWSARWVGGTIGFRKTADGWKLEELSSWIT
jgi:hypothetical protein